MIIKMCDRCGKRIEPKKPILRPNGKVCDVWLASELELFGRTGRRYDLCFECANDLKAFLQGRITAITDQTMNAIGKMGEKAHGGE